MCLALFQVFGEFGRRENYTFNQITHNSSLQLKVSIDPQEPQKNSAPHPCLGSEVSCPYNLARNTRESSSAQSV